MESGSLSKHVLADRLAWFGRMVDQIRSLPLQDREAFFADSRNAWAAESCLRRALEALFDIGKDILARAHGEGSAEYKEVARRLGETQVLSAREANLLSRLAGYRNRLVHFYHEVSAEELYEFCSAQMDDLITIGRAYRHWLATREYLLDESL